MKLKPEDFDKIEDKKLANVLRKLQKEQSLTARDEAILERERAKVSAAAGAPVTPVAAEAYVGTWDELGARLVPPVSRRAIQDWRSDPRYKAEIERRHKLLERQDGRHCVAEWQRLMVDLNLKRGKAAAEATDDSPNADDADPSLIKPPAYGGTQADWTKAKIAKDVEAKAIEIDKSRGVLLEAGELEQPFGAFLAALQSRLTQFPEIAARRVKGIPDEAECRDHLRDEIDAVATDLQLGRYLAEDAVRLVLEDPLPAQIEAAIAALLFSGSDREAFLALISEVAMEAMRRIGRRALADANRRASDHPPAPEEYSAPEAAPTAPPQKGSVSPAKAPAATGKSRTATGGKSRKRKARPQPTPPPGDIEGAIVNYQTATRRRRR